MLQQRITGTLVAILVAIPLIFVGCDPAASGETGTMKVMLHDNPADYDEVNVFIEGVEVNNAEDDTGWVEIGTPQETFDLLELTNGAMEELGTEELEAGTYEQIRLILGSDGHSVVIDSVEHDLKVPSGAQTGIKLNINAEIEPDITYTILLDFDAHRSVVKAGNEQSGVQYLLKPVISATNQAVTGNIAGVVDPAEAEPVVYAIAGSDTLTSTQADTSDGSFTLVGLEAGTYTVSIDPTNDTYQSQDTTGVDVTVGETNDIGTITLSQN